jgi:hypothetical protein
MSGLLRPVGPETASTYWVRRALVFGATMVLAVAVALIISGTSSGSAFRTNPPPRTAGYAMPSSAAPSWMQTAIPTTAGIESSASATATPAPMATTRNASTKKSDRSGSLDCSGEDLRPTLTSKQRLALKKPNTFQLSLINGSDQTCMARVTRKNFTLTIDSGSDRIWSTGLSIRHQADQPEARRRTRGCVVSDLGRQALQARLQVGSQGDAPGHLRRDRQIGGCGAGATPDDLGGVTVAYRRAALLRSCSRIALGIRRRRRRSQRKSTSARSFVHCSLRSLRLALGSRCLPRSPPGKENVPPPSLSLADEERVRSLARPGQRRASLAPRGGARFPTLAAR